MPGRKAPRSEGGRPLADPRPEAGGATRRRRVLRSLVQVAVPTTHAADPMTPSMLRTQGSASPQAAHRENIDRAEAAYPQVTPMGDPMPPSDPKNWRIDGSRVTVERLSDWMAAANWVSWIAPRRLCNQRRSSNSAFLFWNSSSERIPLSRRAAIFAIWPGMSSWPPPG